MEAQQMKQGVRESVGVERELNALLEVTLRLEHELGMVIEERS